MEKYEKTNLKSIWQIRYIIRGIQKGAELSLSMINVVLNLNYISMEKGISYKEKLEADTGFKFTTNVWEVFTEAETNDDVNIEELYRELFRKWHDDVKMVAELSMCMNWKLWEHYEQKNEQLAELYNDLRLRVH